jgi:hypothetical protein
MATMINQGQQGCVRGGQGMSNHDPNEDWLREIEAMTGRFAKAATELRDEAKATADEMRARGDVIDAMLRARHRLPQASQPSNQPEASELGNVPRSEMADVVTSIKDFIAEQQDRLFLNAEEMAHAKDAKTVLDIQQRYIRESVEALINPRFKLMRNPISHTPGHAVSPSSDQIKDKHTETQGEA